METRTRRRTAPTAAAPLAEGDHYHRWRIDEPNGPTSEGLCKVCGVTRQFRNWLQEGDFITNEEHRIAA